MRIDNRVWANNVWDLTVWADDVWLEAGGVIATPTPTTYEGGTAKLAREILESMPSPVIHHYDDDMMVILHAFCATRRKQ